MKVNFRKSKDDNLWYLTVFGNADVLRKFANIWKCIRAKIEENTGGIVQYDKNYMKIKNLRAVIICQQIRLSIFT